MSNKDEKIIHSADPAVRVLNVGYGNWVSADKIVAILESGSLPIRRLREKAAGRNQLIDATAGRKMRSLIVVDSNHVILSSLTTQTLQDRFRGLRQFNPARLELEEGEFVS